MEGATVDTRSVLAMFADLSPKNQKKAHRLALKKGTSILVNETKKNFKSVVRKPNSPNRWNGRSFSSGIRSSISRDVTSAKVHILGDFRLKFFEMGTKERFYRRKRKHFNGSSGRITAHYFFRSARQSKESEVSSNMNSIIEQSIKRVNEQYSNR